MVVMVVGRRESKTESEKKKKRLCQRNEEGYDIGKRASNLIERVCDCCYCC